MKFHKAGYPRTNKYYEQKNIIRDAISSRRGFYDGIITSSFFFIRQRYIFVRMVVIIMYRVLATKGTCVQ